MDEQKLTQKEIQFLTEVRKVESNALKEASPLFIMANDLAERGYLIREHGRNGWRYYSLSDQGMVAIGISEPVAPEADPRDAEIARLKAALEPFAAEYESLLSAEREGFTGRFQEYMERYSHRLRRLKPRSL